MMIASIARGAVVAASVTAAIVLPRSVDLATQAWLGLLVALHLAFPVAAAFWGRRADTLGLDVGLAGIGLAYIGVLALAEDGSAGLYLGLPLAYAAYGVFATLVFDGASRWRRVLRLRSIKRVRAARGRASVAG